MNQTELLNYQNSELSTYRHDSNLHPLGPEVHAHDGQPGGRPDLQQGQEEAEKEDGGGGEAAALLADRHAVNYLD